MFGKLLVTAIGIALALTCAPAGRFPRRVQALVGVGAAVLVTSALLSASPQTALLGRSQRYEGVLVLATYLLAGLCGARLLGPGRTRRRTQVALGTAAATAIAIAVIALFETAGLRPLSSDLARPGSLLGNASDEGALGVVYAMVLAAPALRTRRPLLVAGAVAAGLTVVLSASRGALLGLVLGLVVLAVATGSRRMALTTASVAAGISALVFAVPFTRDRVLGVSTLAGRTVSGRNLLWRESVALLRRHPVFGIGPSQFENGIVGQHDLHWQQVIGPANPPASPHNIVLQVLSAGGIVLLAVVVWLAVLAARAGWRNRADEWHVGGLAALAGYAVALCFHFTSPGTTIPMAVFLGSMLAAAPAPVRARSATVQRTLLPAVATLLAFVFALGCVAEVMLRAGNDAVARGDLTAAQHDYHAAHALRPWDADLPAFVLHQFVAASSGGDPATLRLADRWAELSGSVGDDEQVAQNRAALLEREGHYDEAARIVEAQLRRDPDNPMLLLLRGVLYARVKQLSLAERSLLRASEIDPRNPKPWQDLAAVYAAQGRAEPAARASETARRLAAATK